MSENKSYYETHKQYFKDYYKKNKERMLEQGKEYRRKNRKMVTERYLAYRKKIAEQLREQGQIWVYLPKSKRESKMVNSVAKKLGCGEIIAREILEKYNWNYKKVVEKDEQ